MIFECKLMDFCTKNDAFHKQFHCAVFTSRPRSYKELPLRWAELGTVYRYEAVANYAL